MHATHHMKHVESETKSGSNESAVSLQLPQDVYVCVRMAGSVGSGKT